MGWMWRLRIERDEREILAGKPRKILYKLARSANPCERRTAIVSTYFFIRQNDLDDTFGIAEILVGDKEELVQKARKFLSGPFA